MIYFRQINTGESIEMAVFDQLVNYHCQCGNDEAGAVCRNEWKPSE